MCGPAKGKDARQIHVTKVDAGSPADGILAAGDVILGVGGQPFSDDPRTELGKAITAAETEGGGGNLLLIRWRGGKKDRVILKLPVLNTHERKTRGPAKSGRPNS